MPQYLTIQGVAVHPEKKKKVINTKLHNMPQSLITKRKKSEIEWSRKKKKTAISIP
jgi:hypothetical protein